MSDPLIPLPLQELEESQKKTSCLPIVLLLGLFFLIVFVVSVLLLPDKGRRLLRLSDTAPVTQTHVAHC